MSPALGDAETVAVSQPIDWRLHEFGGDSADLGRKTAAVFILRERHPVSRNALSIIALPKAMATNQMGLLDISG